MTQWTPKLIPKTTFQGSRQEQVVDEDGIVTRTTTSFIVESASYQPITGIAQNTVPEGFRDSEIYKVYTTTKVLSSQEGSDQLADQIDIIRKDGVVVTTEVVKVEPWDYNIQGHYCAMVAKINER